MSKGSEAHAIRGFEGVDDLDEQSAFFIRFLDLLDGFKEIQAYRTFTMDLFEREGIVQSLDVGSGTGTFCIDLAARSRASAKIHGVDLSEIMIQIAHKRAEDRGVDAMFQVADAQHLPFQDGQFDAVRSERVFMYLQDMDQAAKELVRVTKSGGLVVVTDADLETVFWDVEGVDPSVLRRFVTSAVDGVPNGRAGSELHRILKRAGLTDIEVRTDVVVTYDAEIGMERMGNRMFIENLSNNGVLTSEEAAEFISSAESSGDSGEYFAGFTYFTVWGYVA